MPGVVNVYWILQQRQVKIRCASHHPWALFISFWIYAALNLPSLQICERILTEAGVGLVPGAAFGECGEGFVRMTTSASDSDVETGFKAILAWAEKQ